MPSLALHLDQLPDDLWSWQSYDPTVKADLFSSAIMARDGLYLIDPISLPESELHRLSQAAPVAGVIVTNANHERAAREFSERFAAPILTRAGCFPDKKLARSVEVGEGANVGGDLEIVAIEGAVAGEVALYRPSNGGTLVMGDALINLEPYGFTFLPRKYCSNEKQMHHSLRQLLTRKAERILFAHGTPILSGAAARLEQLMDADHR
jgi:glyoxylase-like metal-dependent hydrolase (beta-lactamase superfamily II)